MYKLLLIIPCYNEEHRLPKEEFIDYCEKHSTVDFLFVNDGSKDDTVTLLEELSEISSQISFLDLKQNGGKAEAIRQGVLSVNNLNEYDFIGYFDADLAIPLSEIEHFFYFIHRREKTKMAMGCRLIRLGANIDRTTARHFVSRTFATIVSQVIKLKVYDTQNGAKMISTEIVQNLFNEPFITKWLFDVELLYRLKNEIGTTNINSLVVEVPLNTCKNIEGSKLKVKDFVKAPLELFKIWRMYR